MTTLWDDSRLPASLTVVDGGARGGFSLLPRLDARLDVHAFEPDADACARLVALDRYRSITAWPHALDASPGRRTLFHARHGSMSSLFEPDLEAYARHFGRMSDYPTWAARIATVGTSEVETTTLDAWAASAGVEHVHLLKLDTQGTELDVLRGARALLDAGRIAVVYTEVSFLPVYKQQALFPAVDRHLADVGLPLVDCRFYPEVVGGERWASPYAEPPRWAAVGDATFACLPTRWPEAERATKTVATALVLSQLGYGRTAAAWLHRYAGWPAGEIDRALCAWTHRPLPARLRTATRRVLPRGVMQWWRRS